MLNYPSQKIVTVCDKCLTEICFKGQFPCADRLSGKANSITDTEENIGQLPAKTRHSGFNEEDSSLEIEKTPSGLVSHGPFQQHKLTIDGYRIPYMTGLVKDGRWYFTLDERFGVDVPERDGPGVAWLIANALAFGAGYSCFGENSAPLNMFKTQMHCITGAFTEETEAVADDEAQAN